MRKVIWVVLGMCALVASMAKATTSCWQAQHPEVILQCLESAIEGHSAADLQVLLTEDFVCEWMPPTGNPDPANGAAWIAQYSNLWNSGASVDFSTQGAVTVASGAVSGEWTVDCRDQRLVITSGKESKKSTFTVSHPDVVYTVVLGGGQSPIYRIKRVVIVGQ